jgi:hypothetical protein
VTCRPVDDPGEGLVRADAMDELTARAVPIELGSVKDRLALGVVEAAERFPITLRCWPVAR